MTVSNRLALPGGYNTPEQRIGRFRRSRAWEACSTLGTRSAWKPNDRTESLKECICLLVNCAGRDGNLVLGAGPMPDGRIEEHQAGRVREIGAWLEKYGESIYRSQ